MEKTLAEIKAKAREKGFYVFQNTQKSFTVFENSKAMFTGDLIHVWDFLCKE